MKDAEEKAEHLGLEVYNHESELKRVQLEVTQEKRKAEEAKERSV